MRIIKHFNLILLAAVISRAQSFEVASIRPVPFDAQGRGAPVQVYPGGKLTTNATMRGLLMWAYDVKDYQISEMPQWTRSDSFAIMASAGAGENPSQEEMRKMLQTLLADRFQLKLRRENKEMAVYLLTVAKNGPKLKQSPADAHFSMSANVGKLTGTKLPIARLAQSLSVSVGRPVLDQTGLTGEYDFTLEGSGAGMVPKAGIGAGDDGAPSVFTAIQEQLGLKLDSAKRPVEFLSIEHVEKPSEN
jgi:uncharacterized protein (TIGR03435 family)